MKIINSFWIEAATFFIREGIVYTYRCFQPKPEKGHFSRQNRGNLISKMVLPIFKIVSFKKNKDLLNELLCSVHACILRGCQNSRCQSLN